MDVLISSLQTLLGVIVIKSEISSRQTINYLVLYVKKQNRTEGGTALVSYKSEKTSQWDPMEEESSSESLFSDILQQTG